MLFRLSYSLKPGAGVDYIVHWGRYLLFHRELVFLCLGALKISVCRRVETFSILPFDIAYESEKMFLNFHTNYQAYTDLDPFEMLDWEKMCVQYGWFKSLVWFT